MSGSRRSKAHPELDGLYYITHLANLDSILELGIWSHQRIEDKAIHTTKIYNEEIVNRRATKLTLEGKSLWNYSNVFFQPRNPMLYKVVNEVGHKNIAIIKVSKDILNRLDILISDGNAASDGTRITKFNEKVLGNILENILDLEYWNEIPDGKRRVMAECLVPDRIPPEMVTAVHVSNDQVATYVREKPSIIQNAIRVTKEPHMFFLAQQSKQLTDHLSLIKGDMFNSNMQTLTISVNTKGVMGKGLASHAKYLFPDVYVQYQDMCRNRRLKVGKPVVVKSRYSIKFVMADAVVDDGRSAWFLLFATKKDWREKTKLSYITDGLDYVYKNFKKWELSSLALPALGCGLGGLDWKDVGPLMCQSLDELGIPISIYLPNDKDVPLDQLTTEFLLGEK